MLDAASAALSQPIETLVEARNMIRELKLNHTCCAIYTLIGPVGELKCILR